MTEFLDPKCFERIPTFRRSTFLVGCRFFLFMFFFFTNIFIGYNFWLGCFWMCRCRYRSRDGTIWRAPLKGGRGWAARPYSSQEAAEWLRRFLYRVGELSGSVGSHSCKTTLLSYCAKFGVKGEYRRVLGSHSKPKDRSVLEYSRDYRRGQAWHVRAGGGQGGQASRRKNP